MSKAQEKILDCMFRLIAEYGYDQITMDMLCELTGMDTIEIGEYFQSKEEILITIFKAIVDQGFAHTTIVIPGIKFTAQAYKDEFKDVFLGAIKKYESDANFLKVVMEFYIQKNRLEVVKNLHNEYSVMLGAYLRKALVKGMESQAFDENFDLDLNVDMLHTVIIGVQSAIVYQTPVDYRRVWERTVDQLLK